MVPLALPDPGRVLVCPHSQGEYYGIDFTTPLWHLNIQIPFARHNGFVLSGPNIFCLIWYPSIEAVIKWTIE